MFISCESNMDRDVGVFIIHVQVSLYYRSEEVS
jgi:hypothetical protein